MPFGNVLLIEVKLRVSNFVRGVFVVKVNPIVCAIQWEHGGCSKTSQSDWLDLNCTSAAGERVNSLILALITKTW